MALLIVEGEEVIRLGDSTSHGGKVLTASSNVFYGGIEVARVGDSVSCPKCKGTYTIVSGAQSVFNNEQIARNGDSVSCGAKLIAGSGATFSGAPINNEETQSYDERFQIVDEDTGEPLASYPYYIETAAGTVYSGETDEEGYTPRLCSRDPEAVEVYVGYEALKMQGKA
jgi:uncharacterized Zn-binding protein involved in type VI secretion